MVDNVEGSWRAMLSVMPQAGMIGCMWAVFSGYRQPLPARLALFHGFVGNCSIWWIDFQDLYVSNRLLWLQQCSPAWEKLPFTFSAADCFLSWRIGLDCSRRLKHQLLAKPAGIAAAMWPVSFSSQCVESRLLVFSCTAGHPRFHPFSFHLRSIQFNLWMTRSSLRECQW